MSRFLVIREAFTKQEQIYTNKAQWTQGKQKPNVRTQCVYALMNKICDVMSQTGVFELLTQS